MQIFDLYGEELAETYKNNHKSRLSRHGYALEEIEREGKTDEPLRNQQSDT